MPQHYTVYRASDWGVQERYQESVHEIRKNLRGVERAALTFSASVKKLFTSYERLLTSLVAETSKDPSSTLRGSEGSARQTDIEAIRTSSRKLLALGRRMESFANDALKPAIAKLKVIIVPNESPRNQLLEHQGSSNESADTLIESLIKTSNNLDKNSEEYFLCTRIIQAHYELSNAVKFSGELHKVRKTSYVSPALIARAKNRIIRTREILSLTIQRMIQVDNVYVDFFYRYLLATTGGTDECNSQDTTMKRKDDTKAASLEAIKEDTVISSTSKGRAESFVSATSTISSALVSTDWVHA
ncbi:hypothetical protein BgAZ_403260 [Babesia gibsoni]|uniref:Uncharacterized protein n=1 Tax=Babesia gibsoni TaxID=33632 RepID=A0AAD8LNG1_BABGI|nr:hypothetical protein BgAZ_403260 [Babesia gibsoni]